MAFFVSVTFVESLRHPQFNVTFRPSRVFGIVTLAETYELGLRIWPEPQNR